VASVSIVRSKKRQLTVIFNEFLHHLQALARRYSKSRLACYRRPPPKIPSIGKLHRIEHRFVFLKMLA
jgi:hypothetical protein